MITGTAPAGRVSVGLLVAPLLAALALAGCASSSTPPARTSTTSSPSSTTPPAPTTSSAGASASPQAASCARASALFTAAGMTGWSLANPAPDGAMFCNFRTARYSLGLSLTAMPPLRGQTAMTRIRAFVHDPGFVAVVDTPAEVVFSAPAGTTAAVYRHDVLLSVLGGRRTTSGGFVLSKEDARYLVRTTERLLARF